VADALRPASLLAGAVCLWAVLVLLLAFAGLGARVADSGLQPVAPAIPRATLTATRSRLGPLLNYAQVGQRPLLSPDRRPPAQVADATGGTDELDVMLTSVLLTPRLRLAIFTDNKDQSSRRVRVGENVAGTNWRLASLEPRRATLDGPGGQRTLELRVYDGQGGTPPTTVAGTSGEDRGAADASGANAGAAGEGSAKPTPEQAAQIPHGRDITPPPATAGPVRPAPSPTPSPTPNTQPAPTPQDAQIEAIRRRIEARRAQMRAEAGAAGNPNR
jgi:general secretion pathway protein N